MFWGKKPTSQTKDRTCRGRCQNRARHRPNIQSIGQSLCWPCFCSRSLSSEQPNRGQGRRRVTRCISCLERTGGKDSFPPPPGADRLTASFEEGYLEAQRPFHAAEIQTLFSGVTRKWENCSRSGSLTLWLPVGSITRYQQVVDVIQNLHV